jgi:hypothetical protein
MNYKDEYVIMSPFPHWTANRQTYLAQCKALEKETKSTEVKELLKNMVQDTVTKSLETDVFFSWLINFNPMMVQTGAQWDAR